MENWTASFAMSLPRFAQWSAAFFAVSRTSGVALCHGGQRRVREEPRREGRGVHDARALGLRERDQLSSIVFCSV
jgi:hypothetical protein